MQTMNMCVVAWGKQASRLEINRKRRRRRTAGDPVLTLSSCWPLSSLSTHPSRLSCLSSHAPTTNHFRSTERTTDDACPHLAFLSSLLLRSTRYDDTHFHSRLARHHICSLTYLPCFSLSLGLSVLSECTTVVVVDDVQSAKTYLVPPCVRTNYATIWIHVNEEEQNRRYYFHFENGPFKVK